MHVPLYLPVLGKQHLHRVFVFGRQDQHWLRGINPQSPKRRMEEPANLLKLVRNPPRLSLPRIAKNQKMRTPHLNPPGVRVASRKPDPAEPKPRNSDTPPPIS